MKLLMTKRWSKGVPLKSVPATEQAVWMAEVALQFWPGMPRKRTLGTVPVGSAAGKRRGVFTSSRERVTSSRLIGPMKTPARPVDELVDQRGTERVGQGQGQGIARAVLADDPRQGNVELSGRGPQGLAVFVLVVDVAHAEPRAGGDLPVHAGDVLAPGDVAREL